MSQSPGGFKRVTIRRPDNTAVENSRGEAARALIEPRGLQVKAPVFVPKGSSPVTPSAPLPLAASSPAFVPSAKLSLTPFSRPFTPESRSFTPELPLDQPLQEPFQLSSHNPYVDQSTSSYQTQQHEYYRRQPIYYHLYQGPLPHLASHLSSRQAALASFFVSPTLREDLNRRTEALITTNEGTEIPGYFSLVPLDTPSMTTAKDLASKQHSQGFFGIRNWVYKGFSEKDGRPYILRRLEGYRLAPRDEASMLAYAEKWRQIRHSGLVSLIEIFTTKAFGDSSMVFVYDFFPLATTLYETHLSPAAVTQYQRQNHTAMPPIAERILWSYAIQLCGVIKIVHAAGLAVRTLETTKILVVAKNRLRVNCCSISDVIQSSSSASINTDSLSSPESLRTLQQEDLFDLGKVMLTLACQSTGVMHNLQKSMEYVSRAYTPDLTQLFIYLFSKPHPRKNIEEVLNTVVGSWRLLEELNASFGQTDILESELLRELENGRLVRLMTKFGFINERPEFDHDPRWSETGDRYLIKLFRDHIFHQVDPDDGKPVLDLSHVLTELNKLDAGSDDKVMLVGRDGQNCLVVSYREIKNCLEAAYYDLSR